LESTQLNFSENPRYRNANRLYWIFTGIQIACVLCLLSPIPIALVTKAYLGDVFAAVYQYFGVLITVFLAASALAMFFLYRRRVIREQHSPE